MTLWRKNDPELDTIVKHRYHSEHNLSGFRFEDGHIVWILESGYEQVSNKPFLWYVSRNPDKADGELYRFLKRKYPEMLL